MRKICVITGSRAEYGLLSRLMQLIKDDDKLILQTIVTNMHLSPEFGLTYKEIEKDGFRIDKKVEMLLSSDTPNATAKSVGLATIGFADAYEDLKPDLIVVLGDRFEMLAAVTAALFYRSPIAHIHGGEVTEGAYDDAIRHAITKMSHLHFTSTEVYRKRVIQLGENPERVYNVGAIGVDNIKHLQLLSKEELEGALSGFVLDKDTFLVTFHPVTLDTENNVAFQMRQLLDAFNQFPQLKLIFTMPNSDTDGRVIVELIKGWVAKNMKRSTYFTSLGQKRYLSCLQYIGGVIGNSSSGIIEVPSFGIPTLNIGDRQKGRIKAESVFDCATAELNIVGGIQQLLQYRNNDCDNPYDKENTAAEILEVLKNRPLANIYAKKFYDLT